MGNLMYRGEFRHRSTEGRQPDSFPFELCVLCASVVKFLRALTDRCEDLFPSARGSCFLVTCRPTRRIDSFARDRLTCYSTPITRWIGMRGEKRLSRKRGQKRD